MFFLFFSERVGFDGALGLAATYYLCVVLLKAPSGYLSDRAGRRPILVVASLALLAAYTGFAMVQSYAALAVWQALLAAGIACQSGSDRDGMLAFLMLWHVLAFTLHPAILVLVFARNLAMNMTHAPVMAAIAPRIESTERATWLSVQSLAGRLGFSMVLYLLAARVEASLDWLNLSSTLVLCLIVGTVAALAVRVLGRGTIVRAGGSRPGVRPNS